jgi:5-methylcytosine-specific restriction endonuclease McrA
MRFLFRVIMWLLGHGRTRRVTARMRRDVLARDRHVCRYCGRRGGHVHHILAFSRGGPCWMINLCTACHACNMAIGTRFVLPQPRLFVWKVYLIRNYWWLLIAVAVVVYFVRYS